MVRGLTRLAALALICTASVALAACGDDDSSDPATKKKTVEAVSNPAKGSPVLLGIVAVKGEPEFAQGVEAAVKYLNEEANGLLGHRIETRTCETDPSPQQSIECANEMVSSDAVAVAMGGDFLSDAAFPIYEKAGLPVLGERVLGNQQLVNPASVALGPGILGSLAAFAGYIKDELKGDKVVTVSRPAPKAVKALVDAPLNAAGLTNEWAIFSNENPDFTATFAAAAEKKPDVLLVNVDDNAQCLPAMNAIRTVAADIKTIQISCSDDSVLEEAGTLADGELFYGGLDSIAGADSPDTRIFNHIVEAYGQPAVDGFNGAAGVSPTVTLARVLEKQGGKQVTRESVLKAFADSKGVTRFMGPPLECGEFKYPRMCTASLRIFTIEGGKKKVLTDWISYPDYVR